MNKDEKAGLWSERILKFWSSGQTCRDWCTERQIPVSTMTYWILMKRLDRDAFHWPETPDELRQVTLKEMHWLCDGLSLDQKDAFEEHHPEVVV